MKADTSAVAAVIDHLTRLGASNGDRVPVSAVRAASARFGVTERTVWNWLRHGPPNGPRSRELGGDVLAAIAEHQGNRRRAWNALRSQDAYDRSYVQFTRDLNRLAPAIRHGVTNGVRGAIDHGLYLRRQPVSRLDLVLFDHTEADIHLRRIHRGKVELFRPWVSLLIDAGTRVLLNATLTEGDGLRGDPGTESLVALVGGAIRGRTALDGTFVGGVPRLVQCDGAKAHLAEAMLHGYLELGIALRVLPPASPWEDGIVERMMRTLNDELLSTLPGFTGALPDRYAHPAWPAKTCLTIEEFTARFEQWLDAYNYERHHSALGRTAFEAWRDDAAPADRVPDALIRHGFLAVQHGRTVSKNGVRFRTVDYIHADLARLVGKTVAIRHLPNDRSFIDVYDDDHFVCTAEPHNRLTREARIQIVRDRNASIRSVDRIIKRSRQRIVERHLEGSAPLAPPRDPTEPFELDDPADDFLQFAEATQPAGDRP